MKQHGLILLMGVSLGFCNAVLAENEADNGAMSKAQATSIDQDMRLIPAGEFIRGSNKVEDKNSAGEFGNAKPWYLDEHPEHALFLNDFYIDEHEVTNGQFREFVGQGEYKPLQYWVTNGYILSLRRDKLAAVPVEKLRSLAVKVFRLDIDTREMTKPALLDVIDKRLAYMDWLPVVYVNWYDAKAYCEWRGKRLPTEAEWEKSIRGKDGFEFAWGNQWAYGQSNTGEELWDDGVAPVGSYQGDVSPFGVLDMSGNVSEWTADWYQPYPGSDYTSKDFGEHYKVVKGAAWGGEGHYALKLFQRGAYRYNLKPESQHEDLGFRCAMDVKVAQAE